MDVYYKLKLWPHGNWIFNKSLLFPKYELVIDAMQESTKLAIRQPLQKSR